MSKEQQIRELKAARRDEQAQIAAEHEQILERLKEVSNEFKLIHEKNKSQKKSLKQLDETLAASKEQLKRLKDENNKLQTEIEEMRLIRMKQEVQKDSSNKRLNKMENAHHILDELRNQNAQILSEEYNVKQEYEETEVHQLLFFSNDFFDI